MAGVALARSVLMTRDMDTRTPAVGSPLSILIAEHASSSIEWLGHTTSGQLSPSTGQMASDVMVVSQQASEPAAVFASRVSHRLSRLDTAGRAVTRAVLACGPRSDEASLMARARTAQALLASLRNADNATLTLAAPDHADPHLRYELMAIAGALLEGSQTSGPDIRVHFGSAPRRTRAARSADAPKKVA